MSKERITLGFRNKRGETEKRINKARKGIVGELEIVKKLKDRGINCRRVPRSGAIWSMKGDVWMEGNYIGEVKRRKKVNKLLYEMLLNAHFGFIRADNQDWLVVMGLEEFAEMFKAWRK